METEKICPIPCQIPRRSKGHMCFVIKSERHVGAGRKCRFIIWEYFIHGRTGDLWLADTKSKIDRRGYRKGSRIAFAAKLKEWESTPEKMRKQLGLISKICEDDVLIMNPVSYIVGIGGFIK